MNAEDVISGTQEDRCLVSVSEHVVQSRDPDDSRLTQLPVRAGAARGNGTKVRAVPGVTKAKVGVVFDPPWDPPKMSEAAKLMLRIT